MDRSIVSLNKYSEIHCDEFAIWEKFTLKEFSDWTNLDLLILSVLIFMKKDQSR